MIRKKVCMLGAYAVGKTSLVMRFVKDVFSERYQTTIGVRILKKELELDGRECGLLLWDLHGDDDFQEVRESYLRGASGFLLVADGTRADTLEKARLLGERAQGRLGDVPFVVLLNKADLRGEWEVTEGDEGWPEGVPILHTSAKTGEGVEQAFEGLARRMLGD